MPTPQDRIQQAIYKIQHKLTDLNINVLGTSHDCLFIEVYEDKFKDSYTTLTSKGVIPIVIDFPNNEIPITDSSDTNTQATNTLHMYDTLPITAFFRKIDNVKLKDIFLYKIKNIDDTFSIIPFQLVDRIGQGTKKAIVLVQYTVAPLTDFGILNDLNYKTIVEEFKKTNNW